MDPDESADLCGAAVRSGQPVALFQQVYQVVDDHLALFLLPHLLHEHLKPDTVTGERWRWGEGAGLIKRAPVRTAGGLQVLSLNVKSS